LILHVLTGSVARPERDNGPGLDSSRRESCQHGTVLGENLVQAPIGREAIGLDVDEQLELVSPSLVHAALVALDDLSQRVEIERFEGAVRLNVDNVVRHEKLIAYQPDVGFHACESPVEGVQERPLVLVVVVGVSASERGRLFLCHRGWGGRNQQCDGQKRAP
jgi:hypothetical protein